MWWSQWILVVMANELSVFMEKERLWIIGWHLVLVALTSCILMVLCLGATLCILKSKTKIKKKKNLIPTILVKKEGWAFFLFVGILCFVDFVLLILFCFVERERERGREILASRSQKIYLFYFLHFSIIHWPPFTIFFSLRRFFPLFFGYIFCPFSPFYSPWSLFFIFFAIVRSHFPFFSS